MSENMLVRIKPHNPRRGYVMKTYAVDHPEHGSARFLEQQGWYEVSPGMAEYLEGINSEPGNAESPAGFDVCTRDEALKLEDRERKAARAKADAANATRVHSTLRGVQEAQRGVTRPVGTLTTGDLGDEEDGGHEVELNGVRNVPMQTEPKHGTQADVVPRRVGNASGIPGAPAAAIRRPKRVARDHDGDESDLESTDLAADVERDERRRNRDPRAGHAPKKHAASATAKGKHAAGEEGSEAAGEEHRASHTGEKHS